MLESLKPASASPMLTDAGERQRRHHDQGHRVHAGRVDREHRDGARQKQQNDRELDAHAAPSAAARRREMRAGSCGSAAIARPLSTGATGSPIAATIGCALVKSKRLSPPRSTRHIGLRHCDPLRERAASIEVAGVIGHNQPAFYRSFRHVRPGRRNRRGRARVRWIRPGSGALTAVRSASHPQHQHACRNTRRTSAHAAELALRRTRANSASRSRSNRRPAIRSCWAIIPVPPAHDRRTSCSTAITTCSRRTRWSFGTARPSSRNWSTVRMASGLSRAAPWTTRAS